MTTQSEITETDVILYGGLVASITTLAHLTVGRWLRRYEVPRIAVGVLTVILPAGLFARRKLPASHMWLLISAGFAVAGGVRYAFDVAERRESDMRMVRHGRKRITAANGRQQAVGL